MTSVSIASRLACSAPQLDCCKPPPPPPPPQTRKSAAYASRLWLTIRQPCGLCASQAHMPRYPCLWAMAYYKAKGHGCGDLRRSHPPRGLRVHYTISHLHKPSALWLTWLWHMISQDPRTDVAFAIGARATFATARGQAFRKLRNRYLFLCLESTLFGCFAGTAVCIFLHSSAEAHLLFS